MVRKQTIEDMDKISRDRSLIADQANAAPLNRAAVVGEKDIQAKGRDRHSSNLPVGEPEGLLPKILRSLAAIALVSFPAAGGVIYIAWQAGPKQPFTLLLALLPPSFSIMMMMPLAAYFAWERGRAPLFVALPAIFGLLLLNWRLYLGSMGWDVLAFEDSLRGDLAWTSWPILLGCMAAQSLLLFAAENKSSIFKIKKSLNS